MSFQNTIANWLAADGIPVVYFSNINLNNNVFVLCPQTGTFTPIKPRAGYVRIKSNIIKNNANTKVNAITATDGTNVANIYNGDTNALGNTLFYDSTFFFWYDWPVSNINITNIQTSANSATFDVEIAGMM